MSRSYFAPGLAVALLAATAFLPAPVADVASDPSLLIGEPIGRSDIFSLDDSREQIDGWSTVTQTATGSLIVVYTTDLVPGNVYTVWAVVFNTPAACSDSCGQDDVRNPETGADVLYVTGGIASREGQSMFMGSRAVSDNRGSLLELLDAPAPGLIDQSTAELHLIVRNQGAAMSGQVPEQLLTYHGGCTAASSLGLGTGPNECADVQISVHRPQG